MSRPQGSPNRITKEVRELLKTIVEQELDALPERLEAMPPADQVGVLLKLLPYVAPRLQTVEYRTPEDERFAEILRMGRAGAFRYLDEEDEPDGDEE